VTKSNHLGCIRVTESFSHELASFRITHPYYAVYAQDEFHLTSALTLTYGVRYNVELPDQEDKNQYIYLDLTSPSPLNSQVSGLGTLTGGPGFAGVKGVGRRIQETDMSAIDPRIGFAYRIDQNTVARGGFGIFHAPAPSLQNASLGFAAVTTSNPAQANAVTPLFNLDSPFPQGLTQPSGNSLGLNTQLGQNITGIARKQKLNYYEQWSFDVQRQLPYSFVVTLGYAGNNGLHLFAR
jgi:TonB dependent receptor